MNFLNSFLNFCLDFQSSFLPTRKQNKEYLIGLLSRLIETANKSYAWEKGMQYDKNGVIDVQNQNLRIDERKNRYAKCGINTEDKAHQQFLNKDPWVALNSESEHVSKIDQMSEKIKLYEQYAEQNMKMFDMKMKKANNHEPMRLTWTKNDKRSDYVSLSVKRNKEMGSRDSYGGAHGSFYHEMDGPNRNKGGF